MRILMMLFYLLLVMTGISFAVLNASSVKINLYLTTLTMPVSVLMIAMLGLGLLMGFLIYLVKYIGMKKELSRMKAQLKLTEKEIKNLRDIPLKDSH